MDKAAIRLEVLKLTYRKDWEASKNIELAVEVEKYVLKEDEKVVEKFAPKGQQKKVGNPDILS